MMEIVRNAKMDFIWMI